MHQTASLRSYVRHYAMHSNEANVKFPCAFENCKKTFRTYGAFKSHLARDHLKHNKQSVVNLGEAVRMTCPIAFCAKLFDNLDCLLAHMRSHIRQGNEVTCPFLGCGLKYRMPSSFSTNISRRHRDMSSRAILPELVIAREDDFNFNGPPQREDSDFDDILNQ